MDAGLRRAALAPLLLGFRGIDPPRWALDALADGAGGVVLFASNLGRTDHAVRELTDALRQTAGRELVVALDEEGGDVTRLDAQTGSESPGAAALGHQNDVRLTQASYRRIGDRLAVAGITLNLAPVADVNSDPHNPVIGVRSFGTNPDRVARHVAAAVAGTQGAGIAACAKHFPGHGATSADSHHEVATVSSSRAELAATELVPFRAAIIAGVRAVMTGHLLVPALDSGNLATVSRAITTDLLRGELAFTGTVVTDALEMRALAVTVGIRHGFVAALAAGADAIETGAGDYPELIDGFVESVRTALLDGTLSRDRLEDAGERTARLAVRSPVAMQTTMQTMRTETAAVEVIGTVPPLVAPLVIECRPPGGMASGELPWSVAAPLAAQLPGVEVIDMPHVTSRPLVVVVRDPQRHPEQQALLHDARRLANGPLVVVDVGWPDDAAPDLPTIRTRGVAPALLAQAADVLVVGSTGSAGSRDEPPPR